MAVDAAARKARETRDLAAAENPFLNAQEMTSKLIVDGLDFWRDMTEKLSEAAFMSVYGSPALQNAVGIAPDTTGPWCKADKSALHMQLVQKRIGELKSHFSRGGLPEATARALLYIGMTRNLVDERGFEAIRRFRRTTSRAPMPLASFKAMVREQYFMLLIDPTAAIQTIPDLLPEDTKARHQAIDAIRQVIKSSGPLPSEGEARLREITALFGLEDAPPSKRSPRNTERPLHS